MPVSKFTKDNNGAVYTCHRCGKRTRETGKGESHFEACVACFKIIENEVK